MTKPRPTILEIDFGEGRKLEVGTLDRFKDDPPYATEFYTELGKIIVAWGLVERSLDILVLECRKYLPASMSEDEAPVAFKLKLKYLRKALMDANPFPKSHEWIKARIEDVQAVESARTAIIHGCCFGFTQDDPPKLVFKNSRFEPSGVKHRTTANPSLVDLRELVALIQAVDRSLQFCF